MTASRIKNVYHSAFILCIYSELDHEFPDELIKIKGQGTGCMGIGNSFLLKCSLRPSLYDAAQKYLVLTKIF